MSFCVEAKTKNDQFEKSYSQYLNSELKLLQDKVFSLENRMKNRESYSVKEKTSFSIESMSKSIEKSEKELLTLENSINKKSTTNSFSSKDSNSKNSQSKLVFHRQKNAQLIKENERLKKAAGLTEKFNKKIEELSQEFKKLQNSYKRSENLRKKQKMMIEDLKSELLKLKGSKPSSKKPGKKKSKSKNPSK